MATVVCCDRCKTGGVQVVPVLGLELCNACIAEFRRWVEAGVALHVRLPRGAWMEAILGLAADGREITPATVAESVGMTRQSAHWQLNYLTRRGELVRVGSGRYAVKGREAAE